LETNVEKQGVGWDLVHLDHLHLLAAAAHADRDDRAHEHHCQGKRFKNNYFAEM